ncbi:MAG: oligosaccharide flippase family protein, partial [Pyrinomonadaceae bacterium]
MNLSLTNLIKRLASIEVGLGKAFIANFSFSFLNVLLSIAFTRIYVQYLGAEGYGIIGFYNSLSAFFYSFDFGASATVNREMARTLAQPEKLQQARNIARSLEFLVLIGAFLALVILSLISFPAAYYWITPKSLAHYEIFECFLLISFTMFFNIFFSFYQSGLMGMEKHVLINSWMCFVAVIRYFGSAAVLIFISSRIQAFLLWQLVVISLKTSVLFFLFWKTVSGFYLAKIDLKLLKSILRFTAGISVVGLLWLFVVQTDKIVLSKILDLEKFGYYSFSAGAIVLIFGILVTPLYNLTYPLFSKLVASEQMSALKTNYHTSCQFLATIAGPVGFFLAFYSKEILQIWLKNESFASNTASILSLLSICWIGFSVKVIPYRLRLAHGWVRLDFYENLIAIFSIGTLVALGAIFHDAVGAAIGLSIFAYTSAIVTVYLTHRKVLKGEYKKWLFVDNFLPLSVALL